MSQQQLVIMNYALDQRIPAESLRSHYPCDADGQADHADPDDGAVAIILEPVTPDGGDRHGSVRVLLPSGVRVVPSLAVGVWVSDR